MLYPAEFEYGVVLSQSASTPVRVYVLFEIYNYSQSFQPLLNMIKQPDEEAIRDHFQVILFF